MSLAVDEKLRYGDEWAWTDKVSLHLLDTFLCLLG